MKIILKSASGCFYGNATRSGNNRDNPLRRSACGREGLTAGSVSMGAGLGYGFFSFAWNNRILSRR